MAKAATKPQESAPKRTPFERTLTDPDDWATVRIRVRQLDKVRAIREAVPTAAVDVWVDELIAGAVDAWADQLVPAYGKLVVELGRVPTPAEVVTAVRATSMAPENGAAAPAAIRGS